MPARKKALATKRVETSARRRGRDTGPTTRIRHLVARRAGFCCELCGLSLHNGSEWTQAHSIHHRRPRGAGGTRDHVANSPANLLLVCGSGVSGCHGRIERERAEALVFGWLVRQGDDPRQVTAWVWWHPSREVLLTEDGGYEAVAA